MKRDAILDLKHWYDKPDRMPLIIRGARQVGKSTLVKLFCDEYQLDLVRINLELVKLKSIHGEFFKIENLIAEIELVSNKKITDKSLLFFDEIQESPKLLQLLRYFYEERPSLAVLSAGSLLELALKSGEYSFPVGRIQFYHLGPMNFFEFLRAVGQDVLTERIDSLDFSDPVHSLATTYLHQYFITGGMPKAVACFAQTSSFYETREIQEQILLTYQTDFPKYNKWIELSRIDRIFKTSVYHLGDKVIYQKFDKESKSRDIRRIIELLIDAKVLLSCHHTEASGLPLEASIDESIFKLYFIDIGLMYAHLRMDPNLLNSDITNILQGVGGEQFCAQHLNSFYGLSLPFQLNYWLRDKGANKGEIDFVVQHKNQIIPIEVKSSVNGKLKSLFYFCHDKKLTSAMKISLAPYNQSLIEHKINGKTVKLDLLNIPMYAISKIKELYSKEKAPEMGAW